MLFIRHSRQHLSIASVSPEPGITQSGLFPHKMTEFGCGHGLSQLRHRSFRAISYTDTSLIICTRVMLKRFSEACRVSTSNGMLQTAAESFTPSCRTPTDGQGAGADGYSQTGRPSGVAIVRRCMDFVLRVVFRGFCSGFVLQPSLQAAGWYMRTERGFENVPPSSKK